MKRKSPKGKKANVSYGTGSDLEESSSSKSDETFEENGDDASEVLGPKAKKGRTKDKNVQHQLEDESDKTEKKTSPQKKVGRASKSKDVKKNRSDEHNEFEDSDENKEEDSEYQKRNSPVKKAGRGRKSKDLEKSRTEETMEIEESDENERENSQYEKMNSPLKKAGRGRKTKDLERTKTEESKETEESDENEVEDLHYDKMNSPVKKAGRGRKTKDLERTKTEESKETEESDENEVEDLHYDKKAGRGRKAKDLEKSRTDEIKENEEDDKNKEDDDVEYEVEKIVDEKMIRGKRHFLIRWKGYGAESDTWESEGTLNCPGAMENYKKIKGTLPKNTNKKDNKNKKTPEPEEKWDENENFEVVRILDVYFRKDGKKEFLVAWKGYPNSANSWEPEENMDCKDMIERFLQKCDQAREASQKELRIDRKVTNRFTLSTKDSGRRLSKRNQGAQRVHYHDAE